MDASDAQVRKYAEQANALQFIERNIEDLTDEEKIDKMKEILKDALSKKQADNSLNKPTVDRLGELTKI